MNNAPKAEHEMAAVFPSKFLEAIFSRLLPRRGLEVEIRCIPRDADGPLVRRFYKDVAALRKGWPELRELNREEYNIYMGIVPRESGGKHRVPEPAFASSLWVDIDVGSGKPNKNIAEALARIRKFGIKPTIVIKSGYGIHAYFSLKKPTKLSMGTVKELLRGMAEAVGGDLQAAEVARLLRMPNTLNWKKRKPKRCEVLRLKSKRCYRLSKLKHLLSAQKEKKESREGNGPQDYFEFFSRYVEELRMRGDRQAMGLCPFHDDRHPSWSLRVADGVWFCFGCGRAGNAFSFSMLRGIDPSECPAGGRLQEHNAVAIEGGGYVAWKRERNYWRKVKVCNFLIEWNEENRVSDRIRLEDRLFEGSLLTKSQDRIPIRIGNKELCSNTSFYEVLIREAGSKISLNEHYVGHVRRASLLFSKAKILTTNMDFGFQDDSTFLTPTLRITPEGIEKAADTQVDLSEVEHASHLDLKIITRSRLDHLLKHIRDDLLELQPHTLTYPLLGLVGGTPLMHFLDDKTRYALWIVGPSGSGKSFIAKLLQCFFGDFMAEGRVMSWSSTPNSLQYGGYFFKDSIFLVDDYKPAMVRNEAGVVQFLQTYADFYGRSRLTSEIKSRKDYYIRGLLLTTGEDIPGGHASVVARSLILRVDKTKADIERGARCLAQCRDYPGITSRYVRYLLRRTKLRERLQEDFRYFHDCFLEGIDREENSVRIARNLALNYIGFRWFLRFLKAVGAPFNTERMRDEYLKNLMELREQMLDLVRQEQPAQVFLQTLADSIASGAFRLRRPGSAEDIRGRNYIGFELRSNDDCVYIFPKEAMAQVRFQQERLGRRFDWSPHALSKALVNYGVLVRRADSKDAGTRIRAFGQLFRAWKIRKDCLGLVDGNEDVT